MELGKINKIKGNSAEIHISNLFADMGFSDCQSSRYTSKQYDNAKIDLTGIPFNIQVKAGKQKNLSAGKELFNMFNCIQSMFPQGDEVFKKPYLLFHINDDEEIMVYMSLLQFEKFKTGRIFHYLHLKEFKFEMNSEFKSIVSMTFEVFKNEIILKQYPNGSIRNTTA